MDNKTNINHYPGHMAKTKRLIKEYNKLIDIVLEVVDARIPFSSKIKDLDSIISKKPKLMIFTKKDLCDINETNKWLKYYEELGNYTILVDLNDPSDVKKIITKTNEIVNEIRLKKAEKGLIKNEVRALVVGIPNVGKSTLTNRLAGKKVAVTGNMPGVTKNVSWLKTNSNILLLDTPGILWAKFDNDEIALNLASMTAIKSEVLPIDDVAVHILKKLEAYYPAILQNLYGVEKIGDDFVTAYDIIGKKMNCLMRGGEIDYDRVSNNIYNDIKNEKIKGITFDRR